MGMVAPQPGGNEIKRSNQQKCPARQTNYHQTDAVIGIHHLQLWKAAGVEFKPLGLSRNKQTGPRTRLRAKGYGEASENEHGQDLRS